MIPTLVILGAVLLAGAVGIALYIYWQMRGTRLVTCPENRKTAAVEVGAARAALTSFLSSPTIRLRECSRWPEKEGCGQECVGQIEASPEGCLVRTILTAWYATKSCVLCGKKLDPIDWMERKPALLGPDGKTIDWRQLVPEKIPEVLETHKPVCFDCHVAETFRRRFPDLVVDRPWDRSGTA